MGELYLYNGVRLPKLPEWDETVYPYAFIGHSFVNDSWTLYITQDNPVRRENDTQNGIRIYTYYHPDLLKAFGQWERVIGNPTTGSLFIPTDENGEAVIEIVWTNTDILNEDGSLYLAASTPVPVSGIGHKSMVQGWLVGKRLAAMRGQTQQVMDTARLGLATLGRMILGKE